VCFCGARLLVAGDERKVAARIPADERQYETSGDLSKVTCGACRRNRAWSQATAAAPLAPAPAATARKPRARTGTASALIEADPETGLPRIKPEVQARADQVVAAQKARNAAKAGR